MSNTCSQNFTTLMSESSSHKKTAHNLTLACYWSSPRGCTQRSTHLNFTHLDKFLSARSFSPSCAGLAKKNPWSYKLYSLFMHACGDTQSYVYRCQIIWLDTSTLTQGLAVAFSIEHHLRCPIPPCGHVPLIYIIMLSWDFFSRYKIWNITNISWVLLKFCLIYAQSN